MASARAIASLAGAFSLRFVAGFGGGAVVANLLAGLAAGLGPGTIAAGLPTGLFVGLSAGLVAGTTGVGLTACVLLFAT